MFVNYCLWISVNVDVKTKEILILKLLNHILQPTMYEDIREVAREFVIEENLDKYLVSDGYRYLQSHTCN